MKFMKFKSFAGNTIHKEKWLVVKSTIGENQNFFLREIMYIVFFPHN